MNRLLGVNPYTLSENYSIPGHTEAEIKEIIARSADTFSEYRLTTFSYRKLRMMRIAELLETEADRIGSMITSEMGKPVKEAVAEVKKCAWVCSYYADNAELFLAESIIETDASVSKVIYQPLGTILAVMPWNFPFWQVFRFAAPVLMSGNTALLKHASNVQGCATVLEDLFRRAGFSSGVFQNLVIGSARVAEIIASPEVKAVTLTGSDSAGQSVASIAGKCLKKCVLELGGNNAFVVLNDANVELAVEVAIRARLQNCGQSCIAAKRFIIEKEVIDDFIEKLIHRLQKIKMGDPMSPEIDIGPLVSTGQAEEVNQQVKRSVEQGAELIFGGGVNNAFFQPTVLKGVLPGMPVFDEETFGPVFAVAVAESPQHALKLSNLSDFGLGMQVFTTSQSSEDLFIHGADEGAVFINEMVKSDPRLPFGGIKRSGFGRELGHEGIREFVNIKTVYYK